MNRLLQGDVGSGKTFVAMASMLLAIDSGCQAALMAPTQILAEQHYLTFKKWLEPLGVRVMLRTAAKEERSHLPLEGEPQVMIGTHALLYDKVAFTDLGLIVIDEQHKFGVAQRGKLIEQGTMPDVLVMTATPIPRTLTMTIYGDLDVSILDERPAGRGKMITALRTAAKQADISITTAGAEAPSLDRQRKLQSLHRHWTQSEQWSTPTRKSLKNQQTALVIQHNKLKGIQRQVRKIYGKSSRAKMAVAVQVPAKATVTDMAPRSAAAASRKNQWLCNTRLMRQCRKPCCFVVLILVSRFTMLFV